LSQLSIILGRGPNRVNVTSSVPGSISLYVRGGRRRNRVYAGNGYAVLVGGPDADTLVTGPGGGELYGKGGNDRLVGNGYTYMDGGPGDDVLIAGADGGELHGGDGNDRLVAGRVPTDIFGGPGNNVIYARNGVEDTIHCGGGHSIAYVDPTEDGVFDCETVIF